MTVKRFHQFVVLEKGPVNTAIIDFLKGNIYQIQNEMVDKLLAGKYSDIIDFVQTLEIEELIFDVDAGEWVPGISIEDNEGESISQEKHLKNK